MFCCLGPILFFLVLHNQCRLVIFARELRLGLEFLPDAKQGTHTCSQMGGALSTYKGLISKFWRNVQPILLSMSNRVLLIAYYLRSIIVLLQILAQVSIVRVEIAFLALYTNT